MRVLRSRAVIPPRNYRLRRGMHATACAGALLGCVLLAAAAACVQPAGAAEDCASIESVSWHGVRAFATSDLGEAAGVREGLPLTTSAAAASAIVDAYRCAGYLEASARVSAVENESGMRLSVEVSEGRRYVVGNVSLDGVTRFSREEVLEICPGLRSGAPLTREGLESSFETLLRAYGEGGYAECRVSPMSFAPDTSASMGFALRVVEGPRRILEDLSISGGRTKCGTAARIAGVKRGAAFDPWELDEIRRRLSSCGLFSEVMDPVVKAGSSDSLVVVEVPVTELPSSSVSGLLGYSGRDGGAVGFVDLDLGNIMGTGRAGELRWESSGGGLSSYSAAYTEPWLGGLPVALKLSVDHVAQDTTYSTTGLSADARVRADRRLSFSCGVAREKTAVAGPSEGMAGRRTRLALRAGADLDARDDALDPRGGFFIGTDGDWGSRHDGEPGRAGDRSWSVARLRVRSELYRRLHGAHGLFIGACWRKVMTDQTDIPLDQLLRFGGASSLRGYREDQFRAQETALLQIEHRVALGDGGSRLFLFADAGRLGGEGATGETLLGYGLGIRAATGGGLVGLDFALGKGDSWSQAKVHVRLKRAF